MDLLSKYETNEEDAEEDLGTEIDVEIDSEDQETDLEAFYRENADKLFVAPERDGLIPSPNSEVLSALSFQSMSGEVQMYKEEKDYTAAIVIGAVITGLLITTMVLL